MPMTLTCWRSVALPFIGLILTGCAASVVELRDNLDLNQASFRDKLAAKQGLTDEFLACTAHAYDERTGASPDKSSADGVRQVGEHDGAIHALISRIKEKHQAHGDSLQVIEETLADWKSTSYRRLDLGQLRRVVDVIKQWHIHLDFDEDALAEDASRFAQLLLAYNKAYFGDIRYVVAPSGTSQGIHTVVKVTSDGFIDRNGNVWMFPGLSVEATKEVGKPLAIETSRVDSQRLSADLTRVFLEAFFLMPPFANQPFKRRPLYRFNGRQLALLIRHLMPLTPRFHWKPSHESRAMRC